MTSPNAAIRRTGQSLTPGDLVALYLIDLTPIGVQQAFAFTPATPRTGSLIFRGITYVPVDVLCEGFEMTGDGQMPQPRISITNVTRVLSSATLQYQDLIGAKLVRTRTYRQFLDNGATPDTEAAYAQDIYSFDQKVEHSKHQISWNLAAAMDQEGVMLPKRLVLRDICLYKYRRVIKNADGGFNSYDYSKVQCPYTGSQAYDANGQPVSPEKDTPSRHVTTCCKARFGSTAQLPFGGFPGVGRVRV